MTLLLHSPCTGNTFPSTSITGQLLKYSENIVVSIVADISTTLSDGYAANISRNTTNKKSDWIQLSIASHHYILPYVDISLVNFINYHMRNP